MNDEQKENIQELIEIAKEIGAKVHTIQAERMRCFVMQGSELPAAIDIEGPVIVVMSFGGEE